jgi:hypothetical protein
MPIRRSTPPVPKETKQEEARGMSTERETKKKRAEKEEENQTQKKTKQGKAARRPCASRPFFRLSVSV